MFRMTRTRALVAAMVVGLGSSARTEAQTTTPAADPRITQEVFVTATVNDLPTESVPRSVTVLTREYLQRIGVTSLIEGLRLAPGVDPRARGPRDVQTDFSIRGSTFGQNLVLVDGLRLNDSQSGHHNGEIPLALEGVDRVEVVYGAGSAIHGSDALGGTINVISRRGTYAGAQADFGQHGYAAVQGAASGRFLPANWSITGWGSRSDGFIAGREFAMGGAALRGSPSPGLTVDVRHQRRAFGALNFYGPSDSKEWTDLTLAALSWHRARGNWVTSVKGAVRDHHDHFLWSIKQPQISENRHRTDAVDVSGTVARDFGGGRRLTGGISTGRDAITSSNLGDHTYTRSGVFGEVLVPVASQATVQGGLRVDHYSNFGTSVSPSVSASVQATPTLRFHAATGRAFRIPTFTELYYSDPNNLGSPDLTPEYGWFVDGGGEWSYSGWTIGLTPFRRWDKDVIDWIRASTSEKWRSTNVRDVTSTGFEFRLTRLWRGLFLQLHYTGLTVDAPDLNVLSKYVLEFARHQSGGSLSFPLGNGIRFALNVDHRHRAATQGRPVGLEYDLVSTRVSKAFRRGEIFVDGANLLGETYEEVVGVAMPGRWFTAGIALR